MFRTLGDVAASRDVYGEIELRAGNSAAIFTYTDEKGGRRFLKCYIRPNPHLHAIYDYLERNRPPLLPRARLLENEMYVHLLAGGGGWVDVVEGEWSEGQTLGSAAARAARGGEGGLLSELADSFDRMCRRLLAEEWAHGDLKPDNIIVRPDGEFVLVDCDAMWIPSLAGAKAAELGTPSYRCPERTAAQFSAEIDDYPATLISVTLHALAISPQLYEKYGSPECLLLRPAEIAAGSSAAYDLVLDIFARRGMARLYRMAESLRAPLPGESCAARFFAPPPRSAAEGEPVSFVERGKWGFADADGNTAVMPFWDEVLEFRNGRAAVRLAGFWHIIDKKGVLKRK